MEHRRRRRRWPQITAVLTLVVLLAAGGGAYGLGWVDHWRGRDTPSAPAPAPLPIRDVAPAGDAVASPATGTASAERVRRALAGPLRDRDLGGRVLAEVAPLTGRPLLTHGTGQVTPASTLKLLTTAAALHTLGPGWVPTTSVTRTGRTLVLSGGGDVLLSSADLAGLADETADALSDDNLHRVRLQRGTGLFTGPTTSPRWPASYLPEEVVAPIGDLWVDEGHTPGPDGRLGTEDDGRVADPVREALYAFAADLRKKGISVKVAGGTADPGQPVAQHEGAPLDQLVVHILQLSDNEGAEVLGHLMGRDFAGGAKATLAALHILGVPTAGLELYDASGLSRDDRVTPAALVAVLQRAVSDPDLAAILEGLPVAGWTGSLADRFTGTASPARGVAHAKTGTLTGVSALAGIVTDADGTPLVVTVLTDRVEDTVEAREALDDAVAALARCRCG